MQYLQCLSTCLRQRQSNFYITIFEAKNEPQLAGPPFSLLSFPIKTVFQHRPLSVASFPFCSFQSSLIDDVSARYTSLRVLLFFIEREKTVLFLAKKRKVWSLHPARKIPSQKVDLWKGKKRPMRQRVWMTGCQKIRSTNTQFLFFIQTNKTLLLLHAKPKTPAVSVCHSLCNGNNKKWWGQQISHAESARVCGPLKMQGASERGAIVECCCMMDFSFFACLEIHIPFVK